jgi:hypothetical protein
LRFSRDRIITPSLLAAKSISLQPAAYIAVFFHGHHVVVKIFGGPQARSSPSARQGRSEAKWLDRAEDRRTIVHVMAAASDTRSLRRDDLRDERDALIG